VVIDTSALLGIMLSSRDAERLVRAVERAQTRLISAGTVLEASIALLDRYGDAGDVQLDRMLQALGAVVVPVDTAQIEVARDAAFRYGGRRHCAALRFGDYFSYALAATRGQPLLFTGTGFTHTDIARVEW
jgi:ribonuclease VapC